MNTPIINYQNVTLKHHDHVVLEKIDFRASEGELIYLIGNVGTGKSTLLKSLYGEVDIAEGQARVLDYDLHLLKAYLIPDLRRKLGIVFQDFQLLPDRTVTDNLDFVLRATDWHKAAERKQRIKSVLEQVGLEDKLNKYPHELSGGEQQRVAIARAILNSPALLLADEPTGNLDRDNVTKIMDILTRLVQEGKTVIISTHNLELLEKYPGRVYRCAAHQLQATTAAED